MKSESEGDLLLLLCFSVGCSFWRFISRVLFAFFEGHVFFWGDKSHTIQLFSVFLEFIRNRTFSSPTTKCRGEEEEEQTVTPLRRTVFCCVPNSFWVKVTKEMLYEMKWLCWSSSLLDHQPSWWWRCRPKIAHTQKPNTTQEMYFVVTRRRRTNWIGWMNSTAHKLKSHRKDRSLDTKWQNHLHVDRWMGIHGTLCEIHGVLRERLNWCD